MSSGVGLLALALAWASPPLRAETLNVVMISLDAVRPDHLGAYGYARPTSPRIDALARRALVFEAAYAAGPWTVPSVSSLLTSLYPDVHGATIRNSRLNPALPTVASVARGRGYRTAAFVAGAPAKPELGLLASFEDAFSSNTTTSMDFLMDNALAWIRRRPDRPFLLWLHGFNSHMPYACPEPWRDRFDPGYRGPVHELDDHEFSGRPLMPFLLRYNEGPPSPDDDPKSTARIRRIQENPQDVAHFAAHYDGCLSYMDAQVGRLLDALDQDGLAGRTIVVITADHGELLGHAAGDATPRIAHPVAELREELLRVPLIIRHPGLRPARIDRLVSLADLAPSLLGWLGIAPPEGWQGRSLLEKPPRPGFASDCDYDKGWTWRLRDGDWKLLRSSGTWALFDLRDDPDERRDRADAAPEEFVRLGGKFLDSRRGN